MVLVPLAYLGNLNVPNIGKILLYVSAQISFDLLEVEDIQLQLDVWVINLLDEVEALLEAVHVVVGDRPRVDWLYQSHHASRDQERQAAPDNEPLEILLNEIVISRKGRVQNEKCGKFCVCVKCRQDVAAFSRPLLCQFSLRYSA